MNTQPQTLTERFRQLTQNVADLNTLLRTQRELLRQRGISLPPGVVSGLLSVQAGLEKLGAQVQDPSAELEQLRELAKTAALVNSTLELDAVLNRVMDTVIQLTGAERGYLVLRDEDTGEMMFRVARGMDSQTLDQSDLTVSKTIVERVAATGDPVVTINAQEDDRFKSQESIMGYSLRSILCVPLKWRDQIIGVAYADNKIQSGQFGPGELDLLAALANQAAIAIQNARLFEQARRHLAEVTELTQLLDNVFSSIASGVITTDIAGVVTACNQAAQTILGVPADDSTGVPLRALMPLDERLETTLQAVRDQGVQTTLDIEPQVPGRGVVNLNLRVGPLQDEQTHIQGVAIVMDDLTEQRSREAKLEAVKNYLPPALVANIQSIDMLSIDGEQRTISVVSADVRGFSTFSESLPPEDLMLVINKYLNAATDAIHLYEGIVDKYMGDEVVGLFNTQLNPQIDHAVRAVRAALSMRYDVFALHETLREAHRLFYGIGVHTGPAVLGNIGSPTRKDFTALGDAVDISKLLEGEAHEGEVILSAATNELVHDFFETEEIEPRRIKHPALPVVYRVVDIKRRGG